MISQFFRSGSTSTVDVMNLKTLIGTAMLASVAVALQCFVAVATKVVIVFGRFTVLRKPLFVGRQPSVNFADFKFPLTFIASFLRPGSVSKLNATIQAGADRSDWRGALSKPQRPKLLDVSLSSKLWFARLTNLLNRACRSKSHGAHSAGLCLVRHGIPLDKCFRIVT
jgi:hypothetical protein